MKVVILAGGRGTRITEETQAIPKPMIEIGGKPIIWHIMKTYSHYGFNEFIICLGHLGYVIKEYFSHYFLHMSDMTIDMETNETKIHYSNSDPWKITLIDTGVDTMTGGRLKRIEKYVKNETFMLTYGDGVSDVNIAKLLETHEKNKKLATLTAIQTSGRFGVLDISKNNHVKTFLEKPKGENSWINGGYFVLEPEVFNYINNGDATIWERTPLENISKANQLISYKHNGFWKCMDTLRDKIELEKLWDSGKAPWKIWK
ncbi:MAG: glucose-1-phosphate cytidylyltransferase [Elusimicrobia bacterium]|nr:glucose-1-phosphate cytidylyltransferase [Elusimicrobiota bacterium]MBU2615118.1 glucose-1-phosphate cytidylyltransferase [Elusimicrobiota bacterium]